MENFEHHFDVTFVVRAFSIRFCVTLLNYLYYSSADFTLMQVQPAFRPVTRTAAYLSLVAAFMSVVHATLYIILFQGLKSSWTTADFEALFGRGFSLDSVDLKLWNAFVMICMPALWLLW